MTRPIAVVLFVAFFVGCQKAGPVESPSAVSDVDLKNIGLAYLAFAAANGGQPPQQLADLQPFLAKHADEKRAYEHLKNGTVAIVFGVALDELKKAKTAGTTVIAHDRAAGKRGGWAAMGDGTVRQFTKEEFAQAPLAKPKS